MCFPDVWAPQELSYTSFTLSVIFCLIATIGNSFIILAVIKDPLKRLHTPFNYFLVNLAVCNLIVGVLVMTVSAYAHYQEASGYLEDFLAPFLHLSTFICGTASILSLVALTVDRYTAIIHPIEYRQYLSWNHCCIVTVTIWVLSLSIPFLYYEFGYINYLMFYAHSSILIAILVICFVYRRVIAHLNRQTEELQKILPLNSKEGNKFRMKRLEREKNVTKTLLVIMLAFIGTYIPVVTMIYVLQFCNTCNCNFLHVLRDFQYLLGIANSCVNPFICTIRMNQFKKSILALCTCCSAKVTPTPTTINTSTNSSPIVTINSINN